MLDAPDFHSKRKEADIQEKRNTLIHCIQSWHSIQQVYMPIVSSLLTHAGPSQDADEDDNVGIIGSNGSSEQVEFNFTFYLPLGLPPAVRYLHSVGDLLVIKKHL